MDPIYCRKCDESEVATEGDLCPGCVEQMNEDAAIDARERLNRLSEMESDLDDFTEGHGVLCACSVCAIRRDVSRLILAIRHPGFDSLFAEGWRAHGLAPWGIEATP